MKRSQMLALAISVLALSTVACGLCGDLSGLLGSSETLPESAIVEEQAVVEPGAPDTDQPDQGAQSDQELVQPDEGSADAAVPSDDSAGAENVELPVNNIQDSLLSLDSYLAHYILDATTEAGSYKTTMTFEETQNPRALHIAVQNEGIAVSQSGGVERIEIYVVTRDGVTTMYMQNPQDGSWFAITTNDLNDAYGQLPISLNALSILPKRSRIVGTNVMVNNVPTTHFVYNHQDFLNTVSGLQDAQGEAWIDVSRNLLMKLIQTVKGTELGGTQGAQFSSYTLTFEVLKLNDPSIVITLPQAALDSAPMAVPGISTDPGQTDLPMLDDADVEIAMTGMVNYVTGRSVQEAWKFYQDALPPAGWTFQGTTIDTPTNVIAAFMKEGKVLQLIIAEEGGKTRVLLNAP